MPFFDMLPYLPIQKGPLGVNWLPYCEKVPKAKNRYRKRGFLPVILENQKTKIWPLDICLHLVQGVLSQKIKTLNWGDPVLIFFLSKIAKTPSINHAWY